MSHLLEKLKRDFSNMNLKQKLMFSYLFIVLIPTISIGFFSYKKSSYLLQEQVNNTYIETLKQASINITYRLKEIENVSDVVYTNKEVQGILHRAKKESLDLNEQIDDYRKLITIITNLERNQNVHRIRLFVYGDLIYSNERHNIFSMKDLENGQIINQLYDQNLKFYWKNTYEKEYLFQNKRRIISAIRLMRDIENYRTILGVLAVDVDERMLSEILMDIDISQKGHIIIYEGHDTIASFPNRNNVIVSDFIRELQSISQTNGIKKIKHDYVEYLAIIEPIEYVGWDIAALVPVNEITGKSKIIAKFTLLLILLSGLFAITMSLLLSNTITKGIRILAKNMEEVGQGNYGKLIEVEGNDEIAWLQRQYNKMTLEIEELIEQVYKMTISKQAAELKALEGQINPHFLYNTLDTIKWMAIKSNAQDTADMVDALSKFFRLSLNRGSDLISIEDEIKHVKTYIDIQNIRFDNNIAVYYRIDENIRPYKIIKLILQPIIENAIIHGIQRKDTKRGTIILEVKRHGSNIIFTVIDDGVGMTVEQLEMLLKNDSKGYGVKNVNQRIQLHYGEQFGIEYYSRLGIGTCVSIVLPYIKK